MSFNKMSKSKERKGTAKTSEEKLPETAKHFVRDIDVASMETRLRATLRQLTEPMYTRSKVDREMIFALEK